MDIRRVILGSALGLIVYSLWTNWQIDYPKVTPHKEVNATPNRTERMLPPIGTSTNTHSISNIQEEKIEKSANQIEVKTDVLKLNIDLQQGNVTNAELLDYALTSEEKNKPFPLLYSKSAERYVANSNLFVFQQNKVEYVDFHYTTPQLEYNLQPGQDQLEVVLNGKTPDGIMVSKKFIFTKGSYAIQVDYELVNKSDATWQGYMNTQLLRSSPKEDQSSLFHIGSYTGASYSSPGQHRYQKVKFKDMSKSNLDVSSQGGWIAMQQRYFVSAWIPDINSTNRFYTRSFDNDYTIGSVSKLITLEKGQKQQIGARLYLGPEIGSMLTSVAPGLDLTIDYGWLWFLSSMLFSLMKIIYSAVGNWGWAIVLVTVLIKLVLYRLSATSYKSMAAMRKLQPKLQSLRERYGDDKVKISQATMELYRQEKINPLGGCLPIVIQIPVFIALYWVLLESVELRQAPFIFWINDLAASDPYHVLPIIMGATMLIQQKLNPAPPDPTQAKLMMLLPILFTALFWNFPSGLVLYWIVNNTLSILQQWYITRKYTEEKPKRKLVAANK